MLYIHSVLGLDQIINYEVSLYAWLISKMMQPNVVQAIELC